MDYQEFRKQFQDFLTKNPSKQSIISFVNSNIELSPKYNVSIRKNVFSKIKDSHTAISLEIISPAINNIDDIKFLTAVKKRCTLLDESKTELLIENKIKEISRNLKMNDAVSEFERNNREHNWFFALSELKHFTDKYYYLKRTTLKRIYSYMIEDFPGESLELGEEILTLHNDIPFTKKLINDYEQNGDFDKAELLKTKIATL